MLGLRQNAATTRPSSSMAIVEITGWKPGFRKVDCRVAGLGLTSAKAVTDGVLDEITVADGEEHQLVLALRDLGAMADFVRDERCGPPAYDASIGQVGISEWVEEYGQDQPGASVHRTSKVSRENPSHS